jgi:hypothetical protein
MATLEDVMPTPKKPRKDYEPCVCGCGELSTGRSKYHDPNICRSRYWRGKYFDGYNDYLKKKKYNATRRAERAGREREKFEKWIALPETGRLIVKQKSILQFFDKEISAWAILILIRSDGVSLPNAFEPFLRKYLKGESL